MSLINCPDCGHEVSTTAVACPNCGHPFAKPIIERKVVVADIPREENGIPTWVFAVLGIVGVLVLFLLFVFAGRNDEETANRSLNVNVATATRRSDDDDARNASRSDSSAATIPPATGSQTLTVPSTSAPSTVAVPPSSSTTVTSVPSESLDKGTVVIDAKIATKSGSSQAVRAEKFYLLDEDLESILSDADLEPINGQSLTNSFGLAVLYPSRYGDFSSKALSAIKKHIKYDTLTDSTGKGEMKNIEPDSYYLFGVTKSGNGFAVWSSQVSITAGKNTLNLSPQRLTEVETAQYEEE